MEPYRASPSLTKNAYPWAAARRGLLVVAAVSLAGVVLSAAEWASASWPGSCGGSAGVAGALLGRAALACVVPAGFALFSRSLQPASLRRLVVVAAALAAPAAILAMLHAVRMVFGVPVPDVTSSQASTSVLALASLAAALVFLAAAWRLEHAIGARTTGWAWALAGATVVTICAWRLLAATPRAATLADYVERIRSDPFAMLSSYLVVTASALCLAIPALRLRRRLATAPPECPAIERPAPAIAVQLQAAALQAKLALAIGLAALECLRRLPWMDPYRGFGIVFAAGDVALDLLAVVAMARFARGTVGQRLVVMGILLRLPVVLGARDFGGASAIALLTVVGAVLALVGHRRFVHRVLERLEPYHLGETPDAYRQATAPVITVLVALAMAGFILRDVGLFVILVAPTAIVGIRVLSRHLRAASALLEKAENAAARPG